MKTKILSLNKLSSILKKKRNLGLKIVHCHGVFDLVHYGHVAHFKRVQKNLVIYWLYL